MLTAIDLFCGAGGFTTGLEQAGIKVSLAVDKWDKAIGIHALNHSCLHSLCDINDLNKVTSADLIVGGAPCQDFSHAGKMIEGERAKLTTKFAEIIVASEPRMAIMENVPDSKDFEAYKKAIELFYKNGFQTWSYVFECEYWGVPQLRRRLFTFISKDLNEYRLKDALYARREKEPLSLKNYLAADGEVWNFDYYGIHFFNITTKAIVSMDEPAYTLTGKYSKKVTPRYKGHINDAISHTTPNIHFLTAYERSRVQTFPKDYDWKNFKPRGAIEQMIGNAVPVELARRVGLVINEVL